MKQSSRLLLCLSCLCGLLASYGCSDSTEPPPAPECSQDSDCPGYRANANLCQDSAKCVNQACQPIAEVDCSHLSSTCMEGRCVAETGQCTVDALSLTPCDDGDACTQNDTCSNGQCGGDPRSCGNSNQCQTVSCDSQLGCMTTFEAQGTACDDQDPCTIGDACNGSGQCVPAGPRNCEDNNPCTTDSCGTNGCEHVPVAGTLGCDDGDPCTGPDSCSGGVCVGAPIAENDPCWDGNPCATGAVCVGGACVGATPIADNTPCDLDDNCHQPGVCIAGVCNGEAVVCPADNNGCTDDACVPGRGCIYLANNQGNACETNACSTGGTCDNGVCLGTTATADGTACSNGIACVSGETCKDGVCGDGDASSCAYPQSIAYIVTDNPAGTISTHDAAGNLLMSLAGEFVGPAGVAYDKVNNDGFFVLYTGSGGPHTFYKMDFNGANLPDIVSQGSWPLVGNCRNWLTMSSAGQFLSSCGGNRVYHDITGQVLFAGSNPVAGLGAQGATTSYSLLRKGAIVHVSETRGGIQKTLPIPYTNVSGFEAHTWGFLFGVPGENLLVQVDLYGRVVRRIRIPGSVTLFDFSSL